MKLGTLILSLLPLVGVLAQPCDQCYRRSPDLSASSQPLVKRDDLLTFNDAVAKGIQRMAKVRAAVAEGVDTTGGDEKLKQLAENPAGTRQYPEMANINYRKEVDSFLGVDGQAETFYNVVLRNQGEDVCDATYSPQSGLISADNTNSTPCIAMSEALFWEYMRVAATHKISAQGIKGLVRHQITNDHTKEIIKNIYETEHKDPTKDNLIIQPGTDQFYAMIGTPNGASAAYMLRDHPKAIGKTTIGAIMIISGNTNSLIFKYA